VKYDYISIFQKPEINYMLEDYRIGNLSEDDAVSNQVDDGDNPWAHEPRRHAALKSTSETPFNAETPLLLLSDHFITPNELFYVRSAY
jgi:sulfite oxidase